MDLFELFKNNEPLIQETQAAILNFLRDRVRGEILARPAIHRHSETGISIHAFCLLRLNQKCCMAPIILGSCQTKFKEFFYSILDTTKGFSAKKPKLVENDLVKSLLKPIEVNMKRRLRKNLDPKRVVACISNNLGNWATVITNESIQFPFATASGDLVFEIPLFTDQYADERTTFFYGFPPSARILIVDDAPTTRKLVRHRLNLVGYLNLDECGNGQSAYDKIQYEDPTYDLIIADWHMPKISGLELLHKLRTDSRETIKRISLIMLTSESNRTEVMTAIREGVSGYVVKPFDARTLYEAMKIASKPSA